MSKVIWEGATLLAPVPAVLVSCGTMDQPNAFTASWCGILSSTPPKTYVSIRPERHSHAIISQTREFCINLTTADLVRATDFCGVRSGRDGDKLKPCGLTAQAATSISAPRIAQSPLTLECRVTDIVHLGSHDMFMADILKVAVEEWLLDEKGKLRLEKCRPLIYTHGCYYKLGQRLAPFGFTAVKNVKKIQRG